MTDIEALTCALERNPGNDIVASMLTDELIEAKDMTRSEANAHVDNVRRTGREAAQLGDAAELLKPDVATRVPLTVAIYAETDTGPGFGPPILLIPGDDKPRSHKQHPEGQRYWGNAAVITVGAAWVLAWDAQRKSSRKLGRRRPQPSTNGKRS